MPKFSNYDKVKLLKDYGGESKGATGMISGPEMMGDQGYYHRVRWDGSKHSTIVPDEHLDMVDSTDVSTPRGRPICRCKSCQNLFDNANNCCTHCGSTQFTEMNLVNSQS